MGQLSNVDAVRARLTQLSNEIAQAETAASAAESDAVQKHEELQRVTQEALAAQKIADDAAAHLAIKKDEYARVLLSAATL